MKTSTIQEVAKRTRVWRAVICLFWIMIWQCSSRILHNDILLPGPMTVVKSLVVLAGTREFWFSIVHTLINIGIGFWAAFLVALLIGGLSCRFHLLREFLAPVVSILKSIPVASFIILVLVWVSSKHLSVLIAFLVTFPMTYIALLEGYDRVDEDLLEMTQVYEVNIGMRLRYLYVSEILPFVISSAKVAVGMCWKAGISGELIGLPKQSIGEQLYLSKLYLQMDRLFGWTIVIVFVCYVFERIFFLLLHQIEKRLLL